MSDTREALARLLMDWGCDDESAGRCADEVLAEFLVVPRSEVRTAECPRAVIPDCRACRGPAGILANVSEFSGHPAVGRRAA